MKLSITSICWLLLSAWQLSAQQASQPLGYTIEGDEVVFTFDAHNYKKATKDNTNKQVAFSDLEIYDVALSGEFNNWSRKGWKMKKTGPSTYRLRKKLADFDKALSWEFKFIVNEKYWAEPGKRAPNAVRARKEDFWLDVYNLRMYTAMPSETGNAHFKLPGYTTAQKVILTGSFNRWNEGEFEMKKTQNGWELRLQLPAGTYEYKFVVDGKWMHDPTNPNKRLNEFSNYNSVYTATKPVQFVLKGYKEARKIILSGSFNNWDTESLAMKRTDTGWSATVELVGGKIQYKYIVDGEWITDPANPVKEYNRYGHVNSVKMIE